ncbi:seipin-1 [Magnolia sinica]|uniref:seipin-1 n=1 Tax=Magnolia sinica TaxID=86752 RepID=UPI002657F34E|nr:seipin-1 [Magnolia sinica]XP_058102534.1 seipin-1 [Magnolia sinica]
MKFQQLPPTGDASCCFHSTATTMESHLTRTPHRRRMLATTNPPPPPPLHEHGHNDEEKYRYEDDIFLIEKPTGWLVQLITFNLEAISSAFFSFLSMVSESLHRAEEAKESAEEVVHAVPARVARGGGLILRKLGFGVLGAAYVCLVLVLVLVVSVLLGVGLVRLWMEEPVFVREPLHFDYTDVNPSAIVTFGGKRRMLGMKAWGIPVGHTFHVSVMLLMPESGFNRQVGVFQLTAEVISATGSILARSSQPCMLRFRSLPVRLMRTLIMAIPLLMGISSETQEVTVGILRYKEGHPKTKTIRVSLKPRAGTMALPELYTADIIMNSQLPWRKELVRNWKWTFYVWASLYIYITILVILICCMRPIIFPMMSVGDRNQIHHQREQSFQGIKDQQSSVGGNREISDTLRKWRLRRYKRKASFATRVMSDPVDEGSASSVTKEETGEVVEDSCDSEAPEYEFTSP